jgi:hypothetical protein
MGAKKIPRGLHRRLVFGRVAPETLRAINHLKAPNFGRRIDRVVREWVDLKRSAKLRGDPLPELEEMEPTATADSSLGEI